MAEPKKQLTAQEFKEWLNSIEFVDESGHVIPVTLEDDASADPEGDRS